MTIYELIEKYGKGKGEAVMIESTRILSDVLEPMKEKEPKKYWLALRKLYGAMSGCHYNEEFAMHDVADMEYTDLALILNKVSLNDFLRDSASAVIYRYGEDSGERAAA